MTELEPQARRLLELARAARTPSARDKERVQRMVFAGLAISTATGTRAAFAVAKAKILAAPIAMKWLAGSAALAVVASMGYWQARPRETGHASRGVTMAESVAPAVPPVAEPGTPAAVVPPPPGAVAEAARSPAVPQQRPFERTKTRRAAASDTLGPELDLLHEAQAKWRVGDANGALSLLAVHGERYPQSALAPERDALRVLSLCATGRTAEARRVARHFLKEAPRSPLRVSIEQSCASR